MKYIKLYENRHDFVFDEQRFFPATSLVQGEEEPTYFTDVEEVVFELTVSLPTEKVVTGQTYTLAVEYGGADVFSEATVTTTGDVTLNGTQFTANTDGDFSVTATYGDKTVTLNGTSKLMTAAPRTGINDTGCGIYRINIYGDAPKRITFNGEEFTPSQIPLFNYKEFYADLTEQTVFVTATAQEEGKWESDVATATYTIPVLQTFTATISDDTLEDGQTAQMTVMYGNQNVTEHIGIKYTASGDVTCSNGDGILHKGAGVVTAAYSTGSGSIAVSHNGGMGNPNLTPITINVTVAQPQVATNIVFADNDVKSIITTAFGSNGEITEEQAAAVTTWFSGTDSSTNPFYGNTNINSFDEFRYFTGVTEIGDDTFANCSNMTSITIPASVTSIGYRALNSCSSLTRVICDATEPPTYHNGALDTANACPIYVPAASVDAYKAASGWKLQVLRIKSMNIGFADNDVKTILANAYGSNGEITLTQAESVNTWFEGGFDNTSTNPFCKNSNVDSFTEFAYFTGVTEIGVAAFQACSNMQSITLPSSLTSIPDYAFDKCSSLNSVNIPAAVTSIGNKPFNGCNNLARISVDANNSYYNDGNGSNAIIDNNGKLLYGGACYVIPNTVTAIGESAFARRLSLSNTVISNSVTSIGSNAFANCTSLETVSFGNSVTSIGFAAFSGCTSLTKVTLPASVTSIGGSAFFAIEGLTITCKATTPPTLGDMPFNSATIIYVPEESVDTYKQASGWSTFASNIQAKPAPQYVTAVIDCSELEDANPLETCENYDPNEPNPDGFNPLDCTFDGEVSYVENGVITIPTNGSLNSFSVDADYVSGGIVYVKLTHPSAEYKLNADTTVFDGDDFFTCDVTFDSTTLTTTFSNFVSSNEYTFEGDFELINGGSTDIKITRIEVGYVPASE